MTASPPPEPSRRPLGFDDFIGILVAFLSIGAILMWSLGRRTEGFDIFGQLNPADQPAAAPIADSLIESLLGTEEADEGSDLPAPALVPAPQRTAPSYAIVPVVPDAVPGSTTPGRAAPIAPGVAPYTTVPPTGVVPVPIPTESPESLAASPTVTPSPAAAAPDQTPTFADVPTTFWAYPFVEALAERGIVRGFADGTFKPDQPVNRAEFAAMLQSAFEQRPDQRTPQQFSDVPTGFWAIPAINKAYGTGFMEGYPGNVFRPEQPIPRVQAIVSLAKGLSVPASADANQAVQTYQDANQIPNWATNQVAGATEAAIVVNHPNTNALEPNREATRAEVAALVYQALVRDNQAPAIDSQYIVRP